jgi:hypothetical protein
MVTHQAIKSQFITLGSNELGMAAFGNNPIANHNLCASEGQITSRLLTHRFNLQHISHISFVEVRNTQIRADSRIAINLRPFVTTVYVIANEPPMSTKVAVTPP